MGGAAAKLALYEQFARIGKALANPARLELLDLLDQGERSVDELAQAAGMRLSNTSAQLRTLSSAGLLSARRSGTRVYYRLADERVGDFVAQLKEFARVRLADVERAAHDYLGDVDALEPVGRDELAERIGADGLLVLDVRPEAEYAAVHLPGAISIPLEQLAARLTELPRTAHIVAYCRGRYCVLAPDAVRLLLGHGYAARPLDGGLPEWRRAGLATSSEASGESGP